MHNSIEILFDFFNVFFCSHESLHKDVKFLIQSYDLNASVPWAIIIKHCLCFLGIPFLPVQRVYISHVISIWVHYTYIITIIRFNIIFLEAGARYRCTVGMCRCMGVVYSSVPISGRLSTLLSKGRLEVDIRSWQLLLHAWAIIQLRCLRCI